VRWRERSQPAPRTRSAAQPKLRNRVSELVGHFGTFRRREICSRQFSGDVPPERQETRCCCDRSASRPAREDAPASERRGVLVRNGNPAVLCDLFAGHRITARAAFGHSVGIHGAGSATLSAIRISGTRNSNGRLTGRRSWICGLGLAHSRLPILSVRFSYAGILSAGTRANQHRCRHQGNHPFHRMPPFSKDHAHIVLIRRPLGPCVAS
jgi:hypothetical protein